MQAGQAFGFGLGPPPKDEITCEGTNHARFMWCVLMTSQRVIAHGAAILVMETHGSYRQDACSTVGEHPDERASAPGRHFTRSNSRLELGQHEAAAQRSRDTRPANQFNATDRC